MLVLLAAACAPPPAGPLVSAPPAVRADSLRDQLLAPGVRHRYRWDTTGPWAIHLLEVDPRACGIELRTAKAEERLVGRETTSALAARTEEQLGRAVLAAVNADFFSFDPPGVPVGAQVVAGEVVKGPAERSAFGLTDGGDPFIAVVRLTGAMRTPAGFRAPLDEVNAPPAADGVALYNRFIGDATPADTGVVELRIRRLAPPGSVGDTLRGVVIGIDTLPAGVAVPEEGVVLAGRGRGAVFLRSFIAPGDTLSWWLELPPAPERVVEMVGGFPQLLARGEPVHHLDPAVSPPFGEARHPRTAVGWREDGTLLLVTVDGRQPGYSDGMSLAELADLFRRLGAVEALNLDGGGSTTMVVRGRVVNRPSDREGERANANAILILGPTPSMCGPDLSRSTNEKLP